MRLRFLLFVLCLSGTVVHAQTARRIGPAQGLLHPTVYDVAQDPYGFVWIGTRDGLFRYNEGRAVGMEFLPQELAPSRNIQSLSVRKDSTLWIGLTQLGVLAYDIQQMQPKPLGYPRLDEGISVQALHEDGRGRLWAGTSGQGLYYLDDEAEEWRKVTFAYAPEELMFVFDFADQGDTIWIGNSGEHLLYYLYGDDRVHSFAESEEFQSYSKSVDVQGGKVLFGIAEHGLWEISGGQLAQIPSPSTNPRDVAYEGKEIWVSTDGKGMFVCGVEGNWTQWSKQDPQLGIATDQFYSMTPIGNDFWVGTFNDGVTLFPRGGRPIEKLRNPESFTYTSIQSALSLESAGNSIWVGYDGDGLVRYDLVNGSWKPTAFLDNDRNDYPQVVTSMQSNSDGSIWLGTFNEGLFKLDSEGTIVHRNMAFTDFSFGLNNNNIWSLAPGDGDSLWVGTLGGLQLWNGEEFLTPWQEPWAVGRNIMDLERQGEVLWVASEFMGLYRIEGQSITHFPLDYPILDLQSLPDGTLALGTEGGGLWLLSDGELKEITNQPSLTCYGMELMEGQLYLTTNTGLLLATPQAGQWEFSTVLPQEETQLSLFNRKAMLAVGKDLWIGGAGGVIKTIPAVESPASNLLLTGVRVDNSDQSFYVVSEQAENAFTLEAGTRSAQFFFEIMSLKERSGKTAEYRVEGLVEDWTPVPSNLRSLTFNNLQPGKYLLEIQLRNASGEVESSVTMPWTVESYFWQRTWFRVLAVVLFLLLVGGSLVLYQDRKLRATRVQLLETERELLSAKAGAMEAKAKQKSDELSFQLLKTSSRIELLQSFRDRLKEERSKVGKGNEAGVFLQSLIRDLNRELQSENYWDHFERNYRDLHDQFSESLVKRHPKLTKGEIRLSYLIRQKMNNKEIATVLNVSPAAVEKAKYRLKKKIALEKEDSLDQYLHDL